MDFSVLQAVPTWLVVLAILLGLFYKYLTSNFGYLEKQGVKTIKPWPLIGSFSIGMPKHMMEFDAELYKKFGRMYGYYEGSRPVIQIGEPELIKQVCVKDFWTFPFTRDVDFGNDKLGGNFLTALKGEKWKTVRNIMSPSFTTGKLKQMTGLIEVCCKTLTENLNKYAESGEPLQARTCMASYSIDVIALCAFGTKVNSMADPDNPFLVNSRKLFSRNISLGLFIFLFFPKLAKFLRISPFSSQDAFKFYREVVERCIEMRRNEKESPRDFLALMLEAEVEETDPQEKDKVENVVASQEPSAKKKKVLNNDQIIAQSILFLLAGHETTSTVLGFAFYLLAKNPDIQDKLAAEVKKVIEEHDGKITYEVVREMTYLDMVTSEVLRIYPPAPRTERTCVEDGYELGGIILKKGMMVGIPVYSIHHDPENYPDPEKFDPERFSAENKSKRDPFLYLPFGAGPRNCIAMRFALMEVKMTLAFIIKEFVIKTCPQTEETFEYFTGSGLLQPKSITVAIEKRKRPTVYKIWKVKVSSFQEHDVFSSKNKDLQENVVNVAMNVMNELV